jgi:hypothetical protein
MDIIYIASIHYYDNMFCIIIYADDILLLAPSLCQLQKLLRECEGQLRWLGMTINAIKSRCLRVGPRCDVPCASITTAGGIEIPWTKELRYQGSHIIQSRTFKCSLHDNKKSFFRSVNAIFGKLNGLASEEVILQLVFFKCLPVLLYGLECFSLTLADIRSLDFTFKRFMMKLFRTSNNDIINDCCEFLCVKTPSTLLSLRQSKFVIKYNVNNILHSRS